MTSITTPVEKLYFATSERFDVDHDYFNKVFNRFTNKYVYNHCAPVTSPIGIVDPLTGIVPDSNYQKVSEIHYPVETRKYDGITVVENLTGNENNLQNIKFVYADKGSAQELAVSNYLILDNDKEFVNYDPAIEGDVAPSKFYHSTGRGKTTLLGLEIRGSDPEATEKIAYNFQYNFNPFLNNIHTFDIQKMAAFPTVRESPNNSSVRWAGPKYYPVKNSVKRSFLPTKNIEVSSVNPITFSWQENFGEPVYCDENKYYQNSALNNAGRDAWSLSAITLPYGGKIAIDYELDNWNVADRDEWKKVGLADYATPDVGYYNNIAHMRSLSQYLVSHPETTGRTYPLPKAQYAEYYYLMNANTGGLRVKTLTFSDPYNVNNAITKTYQYGTGHYNMPTSEYWQNYLEGFGDFTYNESMKHYKTDTTYCSSYMDIFNAQFDPRFTDYAYWMMNLFPTTRVDNIIQRMQQHYYEYIDEVQSDGAKTRKYYGRLWTGTNNTLSRTPYCPTLYGCIKPQYTEGGRSQYITALTANLDLSQNIGNYKTEYYNATNQLVKQESSIYEFAELASNSISLKQYSNNSVYNGYTNTTANFKNAFYDWGGYELPIVEDFTQPCNQEIYHGFNVATVLILKNGLALTNSQSTLPDPFYQYLTPAYCNSIGYVYGYPNLNNSNVPMSLLSQAKNPLLKLGYTLGTYNYPPNWFSSIVSTSNPWTNTNYGQSDVQNHFNSFINNKIHNDYGNYENDFILDGINYKTQQSYILRPISSTTVNYY